MSKIYEKMYEVTYRDTNIRGECNFSSYMDFMSDTAFSQDISLGASISDFKESDYAWVIFNYDIKVYSKANYKEKLKVVTYIKAFRKFYALRSFKIYNEKEELILSGETLAFYIDIKKGKPCSIPSIYYDRYEVKDDRSIKINKLKMKRPSRIDISKNFDIRYSDIDINIHVGNSHYVMWIIDSMPLEVVKNYRVSELLVAYEKQLKYNNEVMVESQIEYEDDYIIAIHQIIDENKNEISLLQSKWEKIV